MPSCSKRKLDTDVGRLILSVFLKREVSPPTLTAEQKRTVTVVRI